MPRDSGNPSSSSFEGDFAPGEVLIGRYRVIALVGEGGMGQVYLADDLVLGQPVALKFLPEHIAEREGGLERFRAEVRHAREVTHPNVARVHDIGEVAGRHFLTMEFVDGEDLASLVRRIGRLPREKAAEIAQQICAGLGEAHRRGVLHRDLKPANVMLDGEGHVRLTDFGLAVAAEGEAGSALAGTPQYMAPEQLAGLPAGVQSEVYSLGLVLYELYTGRRALRGRTLEELRREHEEGPVAPPSTVLADIDEEVDAVLARCLARDPRERPASVREVARALPGGDPLAAALAAGQTPSPEVVAAAGSQGALAPRKALALLLGSALLLLGLIVELRLVEARAGVSYGKPAAVLRERARELVAELTGGDAFAHEIHWYTWDAEVSEAQSAARNAAGPTEGAPFLQPLVHHSRFGPEPFVAKGFAVSPTDPAPAPGSVHVALGAEGALLAWERYLPAVDEGQPPPAEAALPEQAWRALLERAGFDPDGMLPVEPRREPAVFATERRAWVPADAGTTGGAPRVEAAGARGRPVQLELTWRGTRLGADASAGDLPGGFAWFILSLTALAAVLAWRNVRGRRADVGGGLAVGAYALATHVVLVFGGPVPDELLAFGSTLYNGLSMALHTAVRVTVFYLALEPFARRRWPRTLISWSRLLEGRTRDPAVGREVLFGTFAALATLAAAQLAFLALEASGAVGASPPTPSIAGLQGPLQALSQVFHGSGDAVMFAGLGVFLLVLFRALVPVAALAHGLWMALFLGLAFLGSEGTPQALVTGAFFSSAFLLLLTRVGFLAVVTAVFAFFAVLMYPLTLSPGDWYFSSGLMVLAVFGSLGIWAYRAAVAGRSIFEPGPPAAAAELARGRDRRDLT